MPKESGESIILAAYVPVIHRGYVELFERYADAEMRIVDQDILDGLPHLRKDIRALSPNQARSAVEGLGIFDTVSLLGKAAITSLEDREIVMPDDDVSRHITEHYLADTNLFLYPIFLRWDRENSFVNQEVTPDREVDSSSSIDTVIHALYEEAEKSSDWWRQVGAALVGEHGEVLALDHNRHLPTDYTPWIDGDPRNNARRGVAVEAGTAQHAEAGLIAHAARNGIPTEGLSIFVTTFPCPACAKLIAESGIKSCYFTEGYAMTDGHKTLKDSDVEIVKIVSEDIDKKNPEAYLPYPKNKDQS